MTISGEGLADKMRNIMKHHKQRKMKNALMELQKWEGDVNVSDEPFRTDNPANLPACNRKGLSCGGESQGAVEHPWKACEVHVWAGVLAMHRVFVHLIWDTVGEGGQIIMADCTRVSTTSKRGKHLTRQ